MAMIVYTAFSSIMVCQIEQGALDFEGGVYMTDLKRREEN